MGVYAVTTVLSDMLAGRGPRRGLGKRHCDYRCRRRIYRDGGGGFGWRAGLLRECGWKQNQSGQDRDTYTETCGQHELLPLHWHSLCHFFARATGAKRKPTRTLSSFPSVRCMMERLVMTRPGQPLSPAASETCYKAVSRS